MKTVLSIFAWLCTMAFCMLMAAAVFNMTIYNKRIHVNLPIPYAKTSQHPAYDAIQLDCLARNIFFEARGESAKGKEMVGFVVLERTKSPHFPNTICGVVTQANVNRHGKIIKHQCSFSWYCDGLNHSYNFSRPQVAKAWAQSYTIAKLIITGKLKPPAYMNGVTHYHAKYVYPYWARDHKDYRLVARVGDHLFYRWRKANMPKLELAAN